MKFAKYLEDTQTPEWKRAYIDYRGLKKYITTIRDSSTSHINPGGDELSSTNEDRDLEARAGSSSSLIAAASVAPETQEQVGSPQFIRRRGSAWTRPAPRIQQAILNIKRPRTWSLSNRPSGAQSRLIKPISTLPLQELLTHLTPPEKSFFDYFDAQLEKIEAFYVSREKELLIRTQTLQEQLSELQNHREFVHQVNDERITWTSAIVTALKLKLRSYPVIEISTNDSHPNNSHSRRTSLGKNAGLACPSTPPSTHTGPSNERQRIGASDLRSMGMHGLSSQPDNYLHAKNRLKKAVAEHYRGLELLHNYRIMNLTGFRKALKKFDKVTKIRIQERYMIEKVDKSALGSDKALQEMMKEMQRLYAQVFLHGDSKKAMERLRGGAITKTHHFSTFRSGILLGAALPALASGIYHSTLKETHGYARDALLYIYATFLIPVVFSMLIGLNLHVWTRCNINYAFIFELDVQSRMDYREYYEVPIFLLSTLCYAFWLSFASIGAPYVSPTIWPLVWLAMTAAILFDPLPFLFRSSRLWLLKTVGKLLISGIRTVEFADFWMGDQLCSMVFTLSNMYMFVCVYVNGFHEDWANCRSQSNAWPVAFVLATLPFFIRLIQSIKRYVDSGLITHLINAGKYGFGIVNYLFYHLWRHQETQYNSWFVLYLISTTIYSVYATCWDLLMDWSLFQPRAKRFLLRDELGYSNHIYLYYLAIITNCLIRFSWVFYIPKRGPNTLIRTFVVAFLEMLRRVQWNFYRLENEHLGNMDQYRVTREVPLPYAFDHNHQGDYEEVDSEQLPEPDSH